MKISRNFTESALGVAFLVAGLLGAAVGLAVIYAIAKLGSALLRFVGV